MTYASVPLRSTVDGLIAAASATAATDATTKVAALSASLATTYVAFVDLNGNPLSAERVRIIVDTTVTPNQISDIVVVNS